MSDIRMVTFAYCPSHGRLSSKGCNECELIAQLAARERALEKVYEAAQNIYDNRLGWSDGRPPYAPTDFWERLNDALTGVK